MKTPRPKALGRAHGPATELNRTVRSEEKPVGETPRKAGSDRRRDLDSAKTKTRPRQKSTRKRRRIAKGIYRDQYGVAATVKVNDVQRERRFLRDTPTMAMRTWQDETRASLRTLPKDARHTLAHDAVRYIKQIAGQLASIKDRERNLNRWVEKFGKLRTLSLEQRVGDLNAQLHEWRETSSGATCNHRRGALMNLTRRVYGHRAAAGLSDLVTFPKPSPKARWVERTHIADVLAQLEPGTTLAARLNLMRWTGMRPSQMGRLTPEDFVLDHSDKIPHVIVPRGKGGKDALVPLVEEGIAAAREFIALDAYGPWSTAKANKALAKAAHKAGREAFTTYQIRHSFATALRTTGADVADIQYLYGHTNSKTTLVYAPEVMEKNRQAIERVRAAEQPTR